jgi:type III secretion protein J
MPEPEKAAMPPTRANAPRPVRGRIVRGTVLLLVGLVLGGCKTDLYTRLSEREANEMVAILLDRGIEAGRIGAKDGTSTIQVDQSRFAQAVEILKAGGYPRQSFTTMGEVFKGGGLIASPTEERARYVYALSEELSKTISGIDGVLSARIHVVLPKNDLLKQDATPSSASVFIRHDKDAPLKALLPQIKMLVANSIEGLAYEKVSVVFVPVDRSQALLAAAPPVAAVSVGSAGSPGGLDPVAAAAGGAAAGVVLAGGGFWLARRRRHRGAAAEPPLGSLETLAPGDPSLPPPEGRKAVVLKRVA